MKKIKYLLLGIVSLLGIGCSFGTYFNKLFYVDYNVLGTQNNSSFYLNSNDSRVLYHFNDSNSYGYINPYFARQGNSINWDISNYSLQNNVVNPNYLNYFVPAFNSNGNSALILAQGTNSSRWSAIFPLTSSTTSYDSSYLDFSVSSVYFRIFGDSSCLNTDIITNSDKVFCTPNYIFYYDGNTYTRSSLGNIYDSQYDGVDYVKGPVQSSLGMGYSFAFVSGNGRNNGSLDSDSHLFFKTILFSGSEIQTYGGNFLFFKLNNSKYITGDNSDLLYMALQITGDVSDYSLIYSIYYCDGSSLNSCVFSSGGFINNYQHLSGFNGGLLEFLSSPGFTKIWNFYNIDDNSFSIYGHYYTNTTLNVRSFGLELLPTNGINIIDSFINTGSGGNQSTGSIAINTGFLDLCLNNLEFGELNSYLCNKLFNGNNLVLIPGQTGYYLSYGYDENGNLRFWITYQEDLEQQMSGYIWEQDENGNRYTYLPEEVNSGVDSSNGLKDYFNNWFEHGVFFSCPFHYTDSYYREFKLFGVSHFVPKLGQSFLYPIYCMGAGFREGKNIDFFSGVNLGLESQLLSSPDYNYIYRLFDVILSVLIMFFIIKIYHLLN